MEEKRTSKVVLVDGHSILNRAFYGMPDLTNAAGVHTGAVYGFLKILFKILSEIDDLFIHAFFALGSSIFGLSLLGL